MAAFTVAAASRSSPRAIWRTILGMCIRAGQRLWQGPMQSPRWSLSSSSSAVRRASRTSSVPHSTAMPSSARVPQAGSRPFRPATFTTHTMHEVAGWQPSR